MVNVILVALIAVFIFVFVTVTVRLRNISIVANERMNERTNELTYKQSALSKVDLSNILKLQAAFLYSIYHQRAGKTISFTWEG